MKRTNRLLPAAAALAAAALLVAACGSDKKESGAATTAGGATTTAGGAATTAAGATTTGGAATTSGGSGSGLADDSKNGKGAAAWEAAINATKDKPLKAEGDPIVIAMPNLEGSAGGTFPEVREGAEAAVKLINEQLGGVGADIAAGKPGRPLKLEVCVHKIDPAEAQACAAKIKGQNPNIVTMGVDFFSPLMYPVFAGLPVNQTVPIFVADFNTPGVISAFGGCVSAFPGAAKYLSEYQKADKVAVIYADNAPGQQCYTDTQERFYKFLNLPQQGFKDKPGDPSDNDANVQAILNYLGDAKKGAIHFGIQASDCAEYTKALAKAGNKNLLVVAGSCLDDSVLKDESSKGAFFEFQGYDLDQAKSYDEFTQWDLAEREEAIKAYGPDSPLSTFMRAAFAAMVWNYQILNDHVAAGGDVGDAAGVTKAFQGAENYHIVGYPPINCTDNAPQYQSVCKKSISYSQWDGTKFTPDPSLNGEFIDVTELISSIPPRAS